MGNRPVRVGALNAPSQAHGRKIHKRHETVRQQALTTSGGRIGRCDCGRRARHHRFPSRSMAGSGVDRSWAAFSTSTRQQLETAGHAPRPRSGTRHVHHIPDLLERDFTATAPGEKLVGDITYILTWEGWLYLATVIDCHMKMVVGYAMDDNYKTPLIVEAVRMATRNVTFADDAIFHSDRGSNYTSASFAAALAEHGARQSVGRTGIC